MALTLVSRGGKAPTEKELLPAEKPPVPQQPAAQPESFGQSALRNIARTALGFAEPVQQLAQAVQPSLTKAAEEKLGIPHDIRAAAEEKAPDYFQPQGFAEEVLDTSLRSLPFTLLLGGGPLGAKIVSDITASAGAVGAKELGFGPVGQVIGSLIGGAAPRKLTQLISRTGDPTQLRGLAETAQKQFYDTERRLGEKIHAPGHKYRTGLNKLIDEVKDTTKLSRSDKRDLLDKLHHYENDVMEAGNKINASKLIDRKKEINALFPSLVGPQNKEYRTYLDRAQKLMFETAEDIGKEHPKWLQSWKAGDDITKALNFPSYLQEIAYNFPQIFKVVTNPLAQAAVTALSGQLVSGPAKAGLAAVGTLAGGAAIRKGSQVYNFVSQSPATRTILYKSFQNIVDRNIPALTKNLHALNRQAEKYEKQFKEEKKPRKGNLRLVSRGNF